MALPPASVKHARVLRLSPGAPVELFDGRGGVAAATLAAAAGRELSCRAAPATRRPPPSPPVHLLLGLPKGGKLEAVVRMVGELGIASLRPVHCRRSVPRPADAGPRLQRLGRVALEACAQSGQPWAVEVRAPGPLVEAAADAPASAARLVFWERSAGPLDAALPPGRTPEAVVCVVGPEGGLEGDEVQALAGLGYRDVGLGPARLRVETAAPIAAALVLERLGRLSPAGPQPP